MEGKPMSLDKSFYLYEAGSDPNRVRKLGWVSNTRQIGFDTPRQTSVHMTLNKKFMRNMPKAFGLYHSKDDKRLLGNRMDSDDVVFGKNQLSSEWYLNNESTDSCGHKCYEMWSARTDIGGGGKIPIFLPNSSTARAGYDKDWELRTYQKRTQWPRQGQIRIW